MTIIWNTEPQGSEGWLHARRGAITGSRIRDARSKLKDGRSAKTAIDYAMDVARERVGGIVPPKFQNSAMKTGTEQEPIARIQYEAETGNLVQEVGFASTEDGRFGASVDGLIGADGIWECKCVVSSATLFNVLVDGDISDYLDQCLFSMWLLSREWVDLSLWCPDLQLLHTLRIERNDAAIQLLEADLHDFAVLVAQYESALRAAMGQRTRPAETATERKPSAPNHLALASLAPSF